MLKIGLTYTLRNGNLAIVYHKYENEPVYQFFGKCFDKFGNVARIAFWRLDGRYNISHGSEFDIISLK